VLTAGIDVGTSSVKAVVVDEDGNVVERCRLPSRFVAGPGGRFEHDAVATWWEGPRLALRRVLGPGGAGSPVRAVAVSAMMPSVSAVDSTGRPVGPGLLYGDGRGPAQPVGPVPGAGNDPTASDEMARLAGWAVADAPGAAGCWPAQAVANASLGGEGVIDLASAFATGPLFNGSGWEAPACRAAGLLPTQMPRVAVFGERVGEVSVEALHGGPGGPGSGGPGSGVVLAAGSVDGLCEQLVAGAVEDGDVLLALGSTLVVWLCAPGWPEDVPGLWRVPHVVAGKAMVGGASNAGGIWADWVDRVVRPCDAAGNWAAGGGSDGPGAAVPLWWPWARGERVPWHDPYMRIGLAGADLTHGPMALRRAALESTGFVVRRIVEMASACGTRPRRFIASGGGSANPAWLQAIADVLAEPVVPVAAPETAAIGAAFLARMAAGLEARAEDAARWAHWAPPVCPGPDWSRAAGERYQLWCERLPERRQ
jgi:xylulokinase